MLLTLSYGNAHGHGLCLRCAPHMKLHLVATVGKESPGACEQCLHMVDDAGPGSSNMLNTKTKPYTLNPKPKP
jgi:hypothetical protein